MKRVLIMLMVLGVVLVCVGAERMPTRIAIGQWCVSNEGLWFGEEEREYGETTIQLFEIATRLGIDTSGKAIQIFDILEAIVARIEKLEDT